MSEGPVQAGACCYCIVLITSCILFGVSWDIIEPTEVGLAFDANIQKLEFDKLYDSGRYLIGLGRSFVKFPSTQQTLRFGEPSTMHNENPDAGEIVCRTKDGLSISLEVAVQYLLNQNRDDLYRLYLDTGGDWEQLYKFFVQQAVRDVASRYDAIEFRQARDVIAIEITEELGLRFNKMYATVPSAQLINMEIEPNLEDAITDTQVAKQDVYQAENEQQVVEVEASKDLAVAERLKDIKIAKAERKALEIMAVANAEAKIIENTINAQIEAYRELQTSLNFDTSDKLLSYLWLQAMQNNQVKDLVLSMDYPSNLDSL